MAPSGQKGRNYRRKQTSISSPDDSEGDSQHPPPLRVAPSFADNISSATLTRVICDGDEGEAEEGGRVRGEGEEGGRSGREADREDSRSLGASPNRQLDSAGPLTRRGVSPNGAKRIGSGVGYNMLKSMGWRENTGLGQSSNGIVDPILPTPKPNHLGIGFNPTTAHDAAQEEIRQIQKAKRAERDQKLQEKLEKAEAAEEEAIFMRESFVAAPSNSYDYLSELGAQPQATSSKSAGNKPKESGQCPHCKQRFDTKHALKSHINTRHARLLLAMKRQLKTKRRPRPENGRQSKGSSSRQSARSLAPLSQDFSVYD